MSFGKESIPQNNFKHRINKTRKFFCRQAYWLPYFAGK
jgi:hypothetical protein